MRDLHHHIKDQRKEKRLFIGRSIMAALGMILLFGVVVSRLINLQVVQYDHFQTQSESNRVKLLPIPPTRGLIYDRNGVLLADNTPAFRLSVTREKVKDLDETLERLQKIIQLDEDLIADFHKRKTSYKRFDATPLKTKLSEDEVARFSVHRHEFPGVELEATLVRSYPEAGHTAHVIGYVSAINERDLERIDQSNYKGTSHIGKSGIERQYESILHGATGVRKVEENNVGRLVNELERTPPEPGHDIFLTIDIKVQKIAEKALNGFRGSVVAIEPKTGDVIAMVSMPTYDPNLFANRIDKKTYAALNTDYNKPLYNRATLGRYPPGSTVKPFIGFAGLETNTIVASTEHFCPGFFQLPGNEHKYRCWKKWGHQHVNLVDAIAESCDVYFYELAYAMGIDNMSTYMEMFGFGERSGLDFPAESRGIQPSREWKRVTKNEAWWHGETIITSIGQGFSLITPIQLARSTAILANKGIDVKPHLLKAVLNPNTADYQEKPNPQLEPRVIAKQLSHWDQIFLAMEEVVHGLKGSARKIGENAPYNIAGKTGTAQVFGIAQDAEYDAETIKKELRDHALFIAFAPVENPKIAVAVVVENGESGGGVAAPIARAVMDAYLLNGRTKGE